MDKNIGQEGDRILDRWTTEYLSAVRRMDQRQRNIDVTECLTVKDASLCVHVPS